VTERPELADLGQLVAQSRLRPQQPNLRAQQAVIQAAEHDIEASDAMRDTAPSWAQTMLYEAGLRCSRVIVQAAGYRIAADRGHMTAITAADTLTSGSHHRLFVRLDRMRRTRHDFMYEIGREPSSDELAQ
jgi:hypothetical protein